MAEDQSKQRFVFPKWTNAIVPLLALGAAGAPPYLIVLIYFGFSPKTTDVGYQPEQPIPFSHRLHAGELGLDCRYCHTTVETAGFAAIPPTQTCWNCHNTQVGVHTESPKLKPLRDAHASGMPVKWVKVHDLPDYAYFNHSVHVNRGVSCVSCHGRVDRMGEEGVFQHESLSMSWCLDCHKKPEAHLRPTQFVTKLGWNPADWKPTKDELVRSGVVSAEDVDSIDPHQEWDQLTLGMKLKETKNINPPTVDCSSCHR